MRVTIGLEECIDCGVCYVDCPEVFEEDGANNTSRIIEVYQVGGDPAAGRVPESLRRPCVDRPRAGPCSAASQTLIEAPLRYVRRCAPGRWM